MREAAKLVDELEGALRRARTTTAQVGQETDGVHADGQGRQVHLVQHDRLLRAALEDPGQGPRSCCR
eukprot:9595668-Alexandrium_andersonii.AAC.1